MMAQPTNNRARKALSEIPLIMGRLSVTMDGDEQPVNYPIIVDVGDISSEYFAPTTSPEEYVIRQRGRRSVSIAWSPEKCNSIKNRTLSNRGTTAITATTATPATTTTTTMVLRSSPRKRLHLEMTPTKTTPTKIQITNQRGTPKRTPDKSTSSPASTAHYITNNNNNNNTTPNKNYYPTISKRLRFEEKPIVQLNHDRTPVMVLLRGLTNDQLIDVIHGCIQKEPQLEEHIRCKLPMADIKPMEEQLKLCKRNIFKSLTYQRDVQKSDSKEYGRALSHLTQFKQCVNDACERLNQSKHWDALLDYILMAWSHVRETPIWTNNAHNLIRKRCFKILTWHCTIALKCGKYDLGERRLNHFHDSITGMINDYDDIHVCQANLQQLLNYYQQRV